MNLENKRIARQTPRIILDTEDFLVRVEETYTDMVGDNNKFSYVSLYVIHITNWKTQHTDTFGFEIMCATHGESSRRQSLLLALNRIRDKEDDCVWIASLAYHLDGIIDKIINGLPPDNMRDCYTRIFMVMEINTA